MPCTASISEKKIVVILIVWLNVCNKKIGEDNCSILAKVVSMLIFLLFFFIVFLQRIGLQLSEEKTTASDEVS